jgi:hypothetical protein
MQADTDTRANNTDGARLGLRAREGERESQRERDLEGSEHVGKAGSEERRPREIKLLDRRQDDTYSKRNIFHVEFHDTGSAPRVENRNDAGKIALLPWASYPAPISELMSC